MYQTPYQTPVLSPSNFTDTPSTGEPSFLPTPQLDTQSPLNFRNTQIEWPQAQHNSTEYSDLYSPTQPLSSQSSINISPVSHRFGRLYIGDPGRSLYPTSPVSHPEAPTNIHNDTTQQEEQGLLVSQDAGQHTHLLDGLSELSLLSQLPSGNYNSENYDATNSVPAETGPLSSIHSTAFNNAPPSPYSVQDTERITSATAHHHQPGHDGPSSVTYSSIMNWDHPRNIYMGQHRVGDMTGGYIMSPLSPQKPVFFDVSPEVGFGDLVGSDDLLPIAYDPQGQPIRHRRGGTSQKILDAAAKKRKRPQKYECEICHNRFTSRQNLGSKYRTYPWVANLTAQLDHHNSHEGLLPHPCNLCQKRYRHSRSLNRHKTGAHGIPAKKKKTE